MSARASLSAGEVSSLLVVGAHAFDAEVIAGPFAAAVTASGGRATFLHLSLGEQGHTRLSPAEYAVQKRAEAAASADLLGADVRNLDLLDGFIAVEDNAALTICDIIREVVPDVIVTHWSGSWHKDHRAAHTLVRNGIFFAALPTLLRERPAHDPGTLLFGENWEDNEGFRTDLRVDVSRGMDRWREAMESYELARGLASFPYLDYYSSLYRVNGCLAGVQHAQAFAVQDASSAAGIRQFLEDPSSPSEPEVGL